MSSVTRSARLVACLLAVGAMALLAAPRPAHACTPPPGGLPVYTPGERALSAEVVVVGTVTAVSDAQSPTPGDVATIAVERYLKGSGAATLLVSGYGPSSLCRSQVDVGQRWIFYIVGNAEQGYRAYYKSQFDAVDAPTPEAIASIEEALGITDITVYLPWLSAPQAPEPASPSDVPAPPVDASGTPFLAAAALLGTLGLVVVARRRL